LDLGTLSSAPVKKISGYNGPLLTRVMIVEWTEDLMKTKRQRLDHRLVKSGLAADLKSARGLIMAGKVIVGDHRLDKPGTLVVADIPIRIRGNHQTHVRRGFLKLEHALAHWSIQVQAKTALDLGASTGGFTQCLVEYGAARVYAVDVGTNQLDYRLRQSAQIVSLERTHAKNLNKTLIPDPIDLLTVDVSFTSLQNVLPFVLPFLAPTPVILLLFKPQFQVLKTEVQEGGLVVSDDVTARAMSRFNRWCHRHQIAIIDQIPSVIAGRKGNSEFFLLCHIAGMI